MVGDDLCLSRFNEQESADERWRPILGVESIVVSVISMLSDPNDESPANIDAAVSPQIHNFPLFRSCIINGFGRLS